MNLSATRGEISTCRVGKRIAFELRKVVLCMAACLCASSAVDARSAFGAAGDILWQEEFDRNGEGQGADRPNALAAEGRRVYVAVGGKGYLVRAYNGNSGKLLWQDELIVPPHSSDATAIAVDQGRVYVAGWLRGSSLSSDFLVRAYDGKTGELLWQDLFDLAGLDDRAQKIVVHKGHVYVAGVGTIRRGRPGDAGNTPMLVRAYDARDGKILWQDLYERNAVNQTRDVTSIAAEKGNLYVATNWSDSGSVVRAYDGDSGVLLWQDQRQDAGFVSIAVEKGRLYTAGSRRYGDTAFFWVRAYDGGTGSPFWEDYYTVNGGEGGGADVAFDRGRLYVVGYVQQVGIGPGVTTDFLVRAYGAKAGKPLWQDSFHGLGNRTNIALAVDAGEPSSSPDNELRGKGVYVAGFITSAAHDTEFVVRAYEEVTGMLFWKDETTMPGLDAALAIAAEKGRVYVAGYVNADTAGKLFIRAYDAK